MDRGTERAVLILEQELETLRLTAKDTTTTEEIVMIAHTVGVLQKIVRILKGEL
jgi:hypothetical protein